MKLQLDKHKHVELHDDGGLTVYQSSTHDQENEVRLSPSEVRSLTKVLIKQDHAKIEELLADLGYALLYIKEAQAQAAPGTGYGNINRARELIMKVGDYFKARLA